MIKKLEEVVGKGNVFTEASDLEAYTHDETPGLRGMPDTVVRVENREQIVEILKLANSEKIFVIPRGGGTGLSGGAVPIYGGIVLSLEKMNRILDIDRRNSVAVVEAGVINGNLQREVEKYELFYPVNPASMDSCTIGGNVAEASGGANAVRYGTTKDYVAGMEAVLPTGEVVRAGGKLMKNATDDSFIRLLLGSEGTLGVLTEITMRLVPKPASTLVLIIPFDNIAPIGDAVARISNRKIIPTMIELMDNKTIQVCESYLSTEIPYNRAAFHLLVRLDGEDKEDLEKDAIIIGEICLEAGALEILVAADTQRQDEIWKIRMAIHDALVHKAGVLADEDVVVPRSEITRLILGTTEICKQHSLPLAIFGHLGDGNIHFNFLRENRPAEEVNKILPVVLQELFQLTVSLGGKISGEHGIGIFKKPYLHLSVDEGYISFLRKIKKALDPAGIMNPGKIID